MLIQIFQDALFAAIAAIGFSAISRPPARAYLYCAFIAAVGHAARFWLMDGNFGADMHIAPATLAASLLAGVMAVFLSPIARTPAEACLFPAMLPMIPGIYAYKAFGGLAMCVASKSQADFAHYFYLSASNGLTCLSILLFMAIGATLPIFVFEKISFQATRKRYIL